MQLLWTLERPYFTVRREYVYNYSSFTEITNSCPHHIFNIINRKGPWQTITQDWKIIQVLTPFIKVVRPPAALRLLLLRRCRHNHSLDLGAFAPEECIHPRHNEHCSEHAEIPEMDALVSTLLSHFHFVYRDRPLPHSLTSQGRYWFRVAAVQDWWRREIQNWIW